MSMFAYVAHNHDNNNINMWTYITFSESIHREQTNKHTLIYALTEHISQCQKACTLVVA